MYIINRVKGGGGRRDVVQCGICYGPVAMNGGVGRLVNEVERGGEGEYVDQFCRRIDL